MKMDCLLLLLPLMNETNAYHLVVSFRLISSFCRSFFYSFILESIARLWGSCSRAILLRSFCFTFSLFVCVCMCVYVSIEWQLFWIYACASILHRHSSLPFKHSSLVLSGSTGFTQFPYRHTTSNHLKPNTQNAIHRPDTAKKREAERRAAHNE